MISDLIGKMTTHRSTERKGQIRGIFLESWGHKGVRPDVVLLVQIIDGNLERWYFQEVKMGEGWTAEVDKPPEPIMLSPLEKVVEQVKAERITKLETRVEELERLVTKLDDGAAGLP